MVVNRVSKPNKNPSADRPNRAPNPPASVSNKSSAPNPPPLKRLIENLMFTGLSEYEAKVYLSLLGASPATAYEVSRASGVPTSKAYEVLARLEERGAVASLETRGKKKYLPQEPAEFIRLRRHMMEATLGVLDEGLQRHTAASPALWAFYGYDETIERARAMISAASKTLLVSLMDDEAFLLLDVLHAAADERKVKLASVLMAHPGDHLDLPGALFNHPLASTIQHSRGIRTLVVVADSAEALSSTITPTTELDKPWAETTASRNAGFVHLAEDYIRHDIYMMKLVRRLAPVIKESFGGDYGDLRDVFAG